MKTSKMSLDTIQGKLSRAEMKDIYAGNVPPIQQKCTIRCLDGYQTTGTTCDSEYWLLCTNHGGGGYCQCN